MKKTVKTTVENPEENPLEKTVPKTVPKTVKTKPSGIPKDLQFYKFSAYGFLKNLRFFEPFLLLFFLEMGTSYVEIGILMAVREISTNLLELPTGMIADGFGRRKSMIFSFIAYIASFLVFTFCPGFHFYLVGVLLYSCGEAFRTGTHKAMILTYLELKGITHLKVHYYGLTRSASQMGSAVSSLAAMALVFYQGSFRWVFLVSVVPYILELFLMISYPGELDGQIEPVNGKLGKAILNRFKGTAGALIALFRKPGALKALLSSAVFSGFYKGVKDYLQPLLKSYAAALPVLLVLSDNRRTTVLIGVTYFVLFLLTAYVSRKSGVFADRMKSPGKGMDLTFSVGTLVVLLSGIALKFELYEAAVGGFVLFYLIQNLRKPLSVGYISDHMESRIFATGLSGESQLRAIFAAIFSFLMGLLVEVTGLGNAVTIIALLNLLFFPLVKTKS